MKLTICIFFLSILGAMGSARAQLISISVKDISVKNLLIDISKQAKFVLVYDEKDLVNTTKVTGQFTDKDLRDALDLVLREQPIQYTIKGKSIVISKEPKKGSVSVPPTSLPLRQETIRGRVTDSLGRPIPNVSVQIIGSRIGTMTGKDGYYELASATNGNSISFSIVGFNPMIKVVDDTQIDVVLYMVNLVIDEVAVVNTGYQTLPKERATGSFVQIDNELLDRTVSSNILDRMKGVASGVLFDASTGTDNGFSVRGRSTIFANTDPLIVLDNFAYDGDINTINPNDIERIDVLRDAAAASIWGVRAGNGVIVITTKSGRYRQPVKLTLNANHTIGERPRLLDTKELGTADIIALEMDLYSKGYYSNVLASPFAYVSPLVQLLADNDANLLDNAQLEEKIARFKQQNIRNDYLKYYYRKSQDARYALSLNGGGDNNRYFVSVGHDLSRDVLVSDRSKRLTLNAQNSYLMLNGRLEASLGLNYSTTEKQGNSGNILNPAYLKPYVSLADEKGNPSPVATYKQRYLDTVGQGHLLDWNWRPLDELTNSNRHNRLDNYGANLDVTVKIVDKWTVSAKYQHSKGTTDAGNLLIADSYYTRDLINTYSRINYNRGEVIYPVPLGDIFEKNMMQYASVAS